MRNLIFILLLLFPFRSQANPHENWYLETDNGKMGEEFRNFLNVATKNIVGNENKLNTMIGNLFPTAIANIHDPKNIKTFIAVLIFYAYNHKKQFCASTQAIILEGSLTFFEYKPPNDIKISSAILEIIVDHFDKIYLSKEAVFKNIEKIIKVTKKVPVSVNVLQLFLQKAQMKMLTSIEKSEKGIDGTKAGEIINTLILIENYTYDSNDGNLSKFLNDRKHDTSGRSFSTGYLLSLNPGDVRKRTKGSLNLYDRIWSEVDRHLPFFLKLIGSNVAQFSSTITSNYQSMKAKGKSDQQIAIQCIRIIFRKHIRQMSLKGIEEGTPEFIRASSARDWLIEIADDGKIIFDTN